MKYFKWVSIAFIGVVLITSTAVAGFFAFQPQVFGDSTLTKLDLWTLSGTNIIPKTAGRTIGSVSFDGAFDDITINGVCTGTGCGTGGGGGGIATGTTGAIPYYAGVTNTLSQLATTTFYTTGGNIAMGGNLTVTGTVAGSNLAITNWNTAYGWGNWAVQGLETQAQASSSFSLLTHDHATIYDILGQATSTLASHTTTYNHTNYNTAYAWGDWHTPGFLTTALATSSYQTLDSTLTDIADGTIAENLVNTANPWADDEVADTITASNYLLLSATTSLPSDNLWTLHNDYPGACEAGKYVSAIGDTLTCGTPAGGGGGAFWATTTNLVDISYMAGKVAIGTTTQSDNGFTVATSTSLGTGASVLTIDASGNLGIGTTSPARKFSVAGDMALTGALYDSLAIAGSNGYVLQTTGSAVKWVATSTLGLGGGGSGTVTSVDMSVPTGLTIAGNPITGAGTLALSLTAGYVISSTTREALQDTAYGWGNHASAGYLTVGVNETYGSGWNADTAPPEKDDVYDYLHLLDTDDDGSTNNLDTDAVDTITEISAALKDGSGDCSSGLICLGNHTHASLYDVLGQATSTLASHTTAYNHANFIATTTGDWLGTLDGYEASALLGGGSGSSTYVTVCASGCDYTTDGTNDEVQLQAAIDAAGTSTVFIKNGTYIISTSTSVVGTYTAKVGLRLRSGVTLKGESRDGVIIKQADAVANPLNVIIASYNWVPTGSSVGSAVGIEDLTIDANVQNQTYTTGLPYTGGYTACGILIQNDYAIVRNVLTRNTGHYGGMRWGGRYGYVDGFTALDSQYDGIQTSTSHFNGLMVTGGQYYTYRTKFSNITTSNTLGRGVFVEDGAWGITMNNVNIYDSGYDGFATGNSVYDSTFTNINVESASGTGITMEESNRNYLQGVARNSATYGLQMVGSSRNEVHVVLENSGQVLNNTYSDIYLEATGGTNSTYNKIYAQTYAEGTYSKYGVEEEDSSQNYNQYYGNFTASTSAYSLLGSDSTIESSDSFLGYDSIGVGTLSPEGKIHVFSASAGTLTANTSADELVLENSAGGGLSILTPATASGNIYFGDPDDNDVGRIVYNHVANSMTLMTNGTTNDLVIDSTGYTGMATATPGYQLDVYGDFRAGTAGNQFTVNTIGQASSTALTVSGTSYLATITGTIIGTGTWDLGGATSFELPNGASPTVDADGEIAIDTTSGQLKYYSGAAKIVPTSLEKCFTMASTTYAANLTNFPLWHPAKAVTITDVYCEVDGGTSIAVTLGDGTNSLEAITCDEDGAADDGSIANGTFTADERFEADLASVTGAVNYLNVCVAYIITAD